MGRADYFEEGSYNAVCYECGHKRKASQLRRHWKGYLVCPEHWEPREAQDFVRPQVDIARPPWTQPPGAPQFVNNPTVVTSTLVPYGLKTLYSSDSWKAWTGTTAVQSFYARHPVPTVFGDHPAGDGLTIFQTAFAGAVSDDISVSNLGPGTELGAGSKVDGYYTADFDAVTTFNRGIIWYADAKLSLGSGAPLCSEMFFTCLELVADCASTGKIFQLQFGTIILDVYMQPFSGGINPLLFAIGATTYTTTTDVYSTGITPGFHHIAIVYRTSNLADVYYDGLRIITGFSFAGDVTGQIQMGGSNLAGFSTRWRMHYNGGRVRRAEMYSGASFTPPVNAAAWGPP